MATKQPEAATFTITEVAREKKEPAKNYRAKSRRLKEELSKYRVKGKPHTFYRKYKAAVLKELTLDHRTVE